MKARHPCLCFPTISSITGIRVWRKTQYLIEYGEGKSYKVEYKDKEGRGAWVDFDTGPQLWSELGYEAA